MLWKTGLNMKKRLVILNLKENIVNLSQYNQVFNAKNMQILLCPCKSQVIEASNVLDAKHLCLQDFELKCPNNETNSQLKSLIKCGYKFCIVGHSDRRIKNAESDETISQKIKTLLENNITPILCVGEMEKLDEANTLSQINAQISGAIKGLDEAQQQQIVLAYEPVFSIGTGVGASVSHIKHVIEFVKTNFKFFKLLYGGSVDENNVSSFAEIENIDGVLIGKSSLNVEKIKKIIKILENC